MPFVPLCAPYEIGCGLQNHDRAFSALFAADFTLGRALGVVRH